MDSNGDTGPCNLCILHILLEHRSELWETGYRLQADNWKTGEDQLLYTGLHSSYAKWWDDLATNSSLSRSLSTQRLTRKWAAGVQMPSPERIPSSEEGAKMGPLPPLSTVKEKWKRRKEKHISEHIHRSSKNGHIWLQTPGLNHYTPRKLSQQLLVSYYSCTIEIVLTYGVLVWYGSRSAADRRALQRIIETRHHQLPPSGIFIHKNSHQMILAQFLPCSQIHTKHWTWKPLNTMLCS